MFASPLPFHCPSFWISSLACPKSQVSKLPSGFFAPAFFLKNVQVASNPKAAMQKAESPAWASTSAPRQKTIEQEHTSGSHVSPHKNYRHPESASKRKWKEHPCVQRSMQQTPHAADGSQTGRQQRHLAKAPWSSAAGSETGELNFRYGKED